MRSTRIRIAKLIIAGLFLGAGCTMVSVKIRSTQAHVPISTALVMVTVDVRRSISFVDYDSSMEGGAVIF